MADCTETLQVGLQQDGFCVATGPHDSGLAYSCPVNPIAPVLLKSPVVLHLHCPELFPGEVLKVHAEHLGHFLAMQRVPRIDDELERTLFLGLCKLFSRNQVLSLYEKTLTDEVLCQRVVEATTSGDESHPSVFTNVGKSRARQVTSLLRNLLELFDVNELRNADITPESGEEPKHMLFLYLIQQLALLVSSYIADKDLATIMSVATAVFLEANFCDPLCAATLLKPMFIPFYDESTRKRRKGETGGSRQEEEPEARLEYYRLFTGYELDSKGSDVTGDADDILRWTEHNVQQRMKGCKLAERNSRKLWFVAPQMGDRLVMMDQGAGVKMMGGQTDDKARTICSYLISDNAMAYTQCAIFGTIANMLPCHANSEFTASVMDVVKGSMAEFAGVFRHQSANLMTEMSKARDSCLSVTGVGFSGQDKGATVSFGKVFTGPEDKRPLQNTTKANKGGGEFTSVTLGLVDKTTMSTMLNWALSQESKGDLRTMLSKDYKPLGVNRMVTDAHFYGRYHHRFNKGEFTEVATVKSMSDPCYNNLIHQLSLTEDAKYQLILAQGALPLCTLTLAMTMRQAAMMVVGFFCAELARALYAPKATDAILGKHLVALNMAAKFRQSKDEDGVNVFDATFGSSIKLSGPVFSNPGRGTVNHGDLDRMEWLQENDARLPDYIRTSLAVIGDTAQEVKRMMEEKNVCYNRVVFSSEVGPMTLAAVFLNEDYMIHAPVLATSSMRVFTGAQNSYASVKLCRRSNRYNVKVLNNRCVNTNMYSNGFRSHNGFFDKVEATIAEMVERIKRGVSYVRPSIDANRIKMMIPELKEEDFGLLVAALKTSNIEVIERDQGCSHSSVDGVASVSPERRVSLKRAREANDDETEVEEDEEENNNKKMKGGLTIFDNVDFGFDDSD